MKACDCNAVSQQDSILSREFISIATRTAQKCGMRNRARNGLVRNLGISVVDPLISGLGRIACIHLVCKAAR